MRVNNGPATRTSFSPAKQLLLQKRLEARTTSGIEDTIIPRCERSGTAPLSIAQQRLWFFDQLAPGSPVYNISEGLHLKGRLDVLALEQSLKEIVRRHEALRTTFRAVEGQPVQVIAPAAELNLAKVDLSHLSGAEREREMGRGIQAEAQKPFDLTSDLMIRATLWRLEPEEHGLVITMHPIGSDAWSLGGLYRDL